MLTAQKLAFFVTNSVHINAKQCYVKTIFFFFFPVNKSHLFFSDKHRGEKTKNNFGSDYGIGISSTKIHLCQPQITGLKPGDVYSFIKHHRSTKFEQAGERINQNKLSLNVKQVSRFFLKGKFVMIMMGGYVKNMSGKEIEQNKQQSTVEYSNMFRCKMLSFQMP